MPEDRSRPPAEHDIPDHEEDHTPSRRGAMIGLIAVAILAVAGIWLSHVLHGVGQIQDCVMSGRTNCVIIH